MVLSLHHSLFDNHKIITLTRVVHLEVYVGYSQIIFVLQASVSISNIVQFCVIVCSSLNTSVVMVSLQNFEMCYVLTFYTSPD